MLVKKNAFLNKLLKYINIYINRNERWLYTTITKNIKEDIIFFFLKKKQ